MTSWGNWVRFGLLGLVWGSSFLWIKLALGALSPIQITLARLVLGAAVVLVLCLLGRTRLPRGWSLWARILVPAFFGNALPFTLFALGERTVDSGMTGVLNATTPLWVLLIALVVGVERRPGAVRVLGLVIGFAGTMLIFAPWQSAGLLSWGALECLAASASYGVSYVFIARQLSGRVNPVALAAAQLTLAAGLTALAVPVGGSGAAHLSLGPLLAVVVLGVFGTGLAFAVNNRLLADEGATTASSVTYLVPVVALVLGALALHERVTVLDVVGVLVVLAGVVLSRRRPARAGADRPVLIAAEIETEVTPAGGR
ncbi:MAG TPA: DMT family transporter [Pseudonocardiaceae bacterium]|nr:DMT family transporter [Pseudonocardiaceae bacterium]